MTPPPSIQSSGTTDLDVKATAPAKAASCRYKRGGSLQVLCFSYNDVDVCGSTRSKSNKMKRTLRDRPAASCCIGVASSVQQAPIRWILGPGFHGGVRPRVFVVCLARADLERQI